MLRLRTPRLVDYALIVGGIAVASWAVWQFLATPSRQSTSQTTAPASFVGASVCASCHTTEHELWSGSHHDLAMQVASVETVLGDFDDATFKHFEISSTFYKSDGKFFVRSDGPDGSLDDYEIAYTFGAYPLQQYLIAFPGGRYQPLGIAWDSRPADEGGERWFHLYPDERIPHGDELHWTGLNQTWNHMCAECHTTDLAKNYDLESNSYETTWSEINVACEACHGPASLHIAWAEAERAGNPYEDELKGFVVRLGAEGSAEWLLGGEAVTAKRTAPRTSTSQIESCARCHSRRNVISEDYVHGRPLLDTHLPRLLDEDVYFADGQILDEVYVYGSFLQSKMYRAGVVCTDCHDPHSLELRASGNDLCARCHAATNFDARSHHFHEAGSPGASCANCHVPARSYMVIDPRRDHSIRVPRPDLSLRTGSPNACTGCHTERSDEWAAAQVAEWYGPDRRVEPHFGEVLSMGRSGEPGAAEALLGLAADTAQPDIARATAISLLGSLPLAEIPSVVTSALSDNDPLVRVSALGALEAADPATRLRFAYPLLEDSVRAVRVQAARILASVPHDMMNPRQLGLIDRTIAEYIETQLTNGERPGSHLNIGSLYADRGQFVEAEAAYRTALRLDPSFVQALINLADLYRLLGRDEEGEGLLREALEIAPTDATAHHALGLLLVRRRRMPEAIEELEAAARTQPDDSRFNYVYAVALNEVGETSRALDVLEEAHKRDPYDRDILVALVTFNRDLGNATAALDYARKLAALTPEDPGLRTLLEQLESGADR